MPSRPFKADLEQIIKKQKKDIAEANAQIKYLDEKIPELLELRQRVESLLMIKDKLEGSSKRYSQMHYRSDCENKALKEAIVKLSFLLP